jgi:hypothetical protein
MLIEGVVYLANPVFDLGSVFAEEHTPGNQRAVLFGERAPR